jgi:hypothetical protein
VIVAIVSGALAVAAYVVLVIGSLRNARTQSSEGEGDRDVSESPQAAALSGPEYIVKELGEPGTASYCPGMDGALPCSKWAGHSGPHYFYRP